MKLLLLYLPLALLLGWRGFTAGRSYQDLIAGDENRMLTEVTKQIGNERIEFQNKIRRLEEEKSRLEKQRKE